MKSLSKFHLGLLSPSHHKFYNNFYEQITYNDKVSKVTGSGGQNDMNHSIDLNLSKSANASNFERRKKTLFARDTFSEVADTTS